MALCLQLQQAAIFITETTFSSVGKLTLQCTTKTDIPRLHFNLVCLGGNRREAAARLISHTHSCGETCKTQNMWGQNSGA